MRTHWWSTPQGRALGLFGAVFGAIVAAGMTLMQPGGMLAFAHQVTPVVRHPGPGWFCVFYRGGAQLDHTYLWNDLASAMEGARHADVVFLGSSRMGFALPFHELRAFEKRSRVRAFSLALPFEPCVFPLEILEKFDVRPRVAVAEVDGFFAEARTIHASRVVDEGWWVGRTTVWEEDLAAAIWPVASRLLPSFVTRRPAHYLLRSPTHGAWLPFEWPHHHAAPTAPIAGEPPARTIELARGVRDALAERGTQLVLTCVPTGRGGCSPSYAQALADAIGVPAVTPPIAGLWTTDFIHLCPLSAKRFARTLLRGVGELDELGPHDRRLPHGTIGTTIRASIRAKPVHDTSADVKNGTHAKEAKRNVASCGTSAMGMPAGASLGLRRPPNTMTAIACSRPQTANPIQARGG
jgi:hypothetical protein